ncbi:Thioredoxinlike protein [Phytophthora megakarya]|uniref:Thioredoxinlike protein n=1 Tax=Phytophthora megakarya TaxID=4795 RepID=A0A225VFT1_9STRA|nr:Thioredoxinlike protein [Phytophthora megakarya]
MTALVAEVDGALAESEEQLTAVCVCDCDKFPSAKSFLQSRPAGVYTCARAKASVALDSDLSTLLVEWSFHLQRLSAGLTTMDSNFNTDKLMVDKLKMATRRLAIMVLTQWRAIETVDGMLSVLWCPSPDSDEYSVAVHVCPMLTPTCLASTVLVYGEGRTNARCKHSQWIEDRIPLEKHMIQVEETRGEPIHEVLLSRAGPGGDRLLLEGLITNFFIVKEGKLYTADEGVLQGSTRELVLKACYDLLIPVVLEAPKLSELDSWQAAFVTSAVRVVVDVTCLLYEVDDDEGKALQETFIPSDTSGFTQRIRDQIFAMRMYLD